MHSYCTILYLFCVFYKTIRALGLLGQTPFSARHLKLSGRSLCYSFVDCFLGAFKFLSPTQIPRPPAIKVQQIGARAVFLPPSFWARRTSTAMCTKLLYSFVCTSCGYQHCPGYIYSTYINTYPATSIDHHPLCVCFVFTDDDFCNQARW